MSCNLSGDKMCCDSSTGCLGSAKALLLSLGVHLFPRKSEEQLAHSQVTCEQRQHVSLNIIDVFLVWFVCAEGQVARLKTWDVPHITISTGTRCLDEQFAALMNMLQGTLMFHDLSWFESIVVLECCCYFKESDILLPCPQAVHFVGTSRCSDIL